MRSTGICVNCKMCILYINEKRVYHKNKFFCECKKPINELKLFYIPQVTQIPNNKNHPTKQTVQTGSGDVLCGNLMRSGGSTEVKTDDLNSLMKGMEETKKKAREIKEKSLNRLRGMRT